MAGTGAHYHEVCQHRFVHALCHCLEWPRAIWFVACPPEMDWLHAECAKWRAPRG